MGRATVTGSPAKFWFAVLTDLKTRGVKDVFFVVCDGLKGLPDNSVNAVFPLAIVQTCIIHLIRSTFRYASRRYWDELSRDLKPIYTPPTEQAVWAALEELEEVGQPLTRPSPGCGGPPGRSSCPSSSTTWSRVLFSTNAIESLNARYRRAITVPVHFPTSRPP